MFYLKPNFVAVTALLILSSGTALAQTSGEIVEPQADKQETTKTMDDLGHQMDLERVRAINRQAIIPHNKAIIDKMSDQEKHDLFNRAIMAEQVRMKMTTGEFRGQMIICPLGTTAQDNGTCLITGDYKY